MTHAEVAQRSPGTSSDRAVTVALHGIGKAYDGKWAVDDLSVTVPRGALIALLGPSGCGKTTTLRMIAGLIEPDAGDIRFDDASMRSIPPERREAVMVFQQPTLFSHLDVAANVGFGLRMRHLPRAVIVERVTEALRLMQLTGLERRRVSQISGGQQQRVALARALVTRPRVLLLDEPLSSLDPSLRDEMRELIAALHAAQRITTILVTHDRHEAMTLAERIVFLSGGRLQQYGTARELYERPTTVAVAEFFGMVNLLPARVSAGVAETGVGALHLPDGGSVPSAVVGIRPEHICLGEGPNRVHGRVSSTTYLGLHQQVTMRAVSGVPLTFLAPPHRTFADQESVTVCLPPEHLHVIAPDGVGS